MNTNKLVEMVDSSRETIYVGTDSYGEPYCIDVINADIFVELLKKEVNTHSHWVHHKGEHSEYVSCARCGELAKCTEMADCFIWKYSKYCCGCGSTMDGEIEEVEE